MSRGKPYFYDDRKPITEDGSENFKSEYFPSDEAALIWAEERKAELAPEHAAILFTYEDYDVLNATRFHRVKRSEYRVIKEWPGKDYND